MTGILNLSLADIYHAKTQRYLKNTFMKTTILTLLMAFFATGIFAQNEIKLLIRADDIGSFHAANVACIESYKNGIARSVELMVPCAWYPEAVKMLNENPGFD